MPYTVTLARYLLCLAQFRLFLNLDPLVGLGPRVSCPPLSGSDYKCPVYGDIFSFVILCFSKQLIDTWFMQQS